MDLTADPKVLETSEGTFYGKTVVVVGGGNSSVEDALLLSRIAKKVFLVHRRDTPRATKTAIPGVYAVGDVRTKPLRQTATAIADGAVAVHIAEE